MSTNHDKRELLKLKQGLIEDSDVIKVEEREEVILTGKKKIENFFYHYKIHVILFAFFTVLVIIFGADLLLRKRADLNFLFVGSNEDASLILAFSDDISNALARFTPDFDDNGYSHAVSFPVNLYRQNDSDSFVANQTKLFAEIQTGTSRFIIGNNTAFDRIIGTEYTLPEIFVDLKFLYPRNENIVDGVFYKLSGSNLERELEKILGFTEYGSFFPDDFYIAIFDLNRTGKRQAEAHERALTVLDNIVRGNILTEELIGAK